MPSLEISELPQDVYEALLLRAERGGRTIAEQAILELRRMPEIEARQRRLLVSEALRGRFAAGVRRVVRTPPEDQIREDRDR